jgi:transposase
MDRYIGLDAHSSSCTVAVVGPSGRRLQSKVLETNGRLLIDFLKSIPQPRHLCLEEGTHSAWLYEELAPHVDQIVVVGVGKRRGSKSDSVDAFGLAESIRVGVMERRVYKGLGEWGRLRELSRAYRMVVSDSVRVQCRIKSLFRSRGISTGGAKVYRESVRSEWEKKLPVAMHSLVEILYEELDAVRALQQRAEKEMLAESHRHGISRILETCPGLGPIRIAQLLPVVVTPYRFSSKRAFWSYAGLGIVMRSSSDWVRAKDGSWVRLPVQQTRGLNRNFNRTMKQVFKGAAMTVIRWAQEDDPLFRHYKQLLDGGTKPNLARLTLARQIASVVLSMWRSEEVYNPSKFQRAA